jgi:hypothetical protein
VAREVDAPASVKAVEWRLLTNRAAATLEQANELINWYRARWEIEIYFNVLKNGCEVEELQLSAIDRLEGAGPVHGGGLARGLLDAQGAHLPGT